MMLRSTVGALALTVTSAFSLAGTIRHDVPTEDYVYRSEAFPAVGSVDADAGAGSGTLIAPQWVLTAGHVAGGVYDPEVGDIIENSVVYWEPGLNAIDTVFSGVFWTADQWFAHPDWTGHLEDGFDVGLIHLSPRTQEEIDELGGTALPDFTPMRRLITEPVDARTPANPNGPIWNQIATTVGYGLTGDGRTGFEPTIDYWDFYRRAGDTMIDKFGDEIPDILAEFGGDVSIANQFLVGDFDDPPTQAGWTHNATNRMGGDTALPFEYSVAPADSGGPLLIDHDNNSSTPMVIAGVNSWIEGPDGTDNGTYDDIFGFARMALFNDWVSSIVNTPGDADSDFDVDLADLGALATNYGIGTGGHWHLGDFDLDGDVDLNDLGTLATNYGAGQTQAFADFQMLTSVPEPASLSLLALGAAAIQRRRSRHGMKVS